MFPGDKIRFLTDILRKQTALRNQIESRANITIGFSTAILAFTLSQSLQGKTNTGLIIILSFSILALLSGLLALKPLQLFTSKGQAQSVFYHTAIAKQDLATYTKKLKDITNSEQKVLEQYALEIHNMTYHSIRIKKFLSNLSIKLLVSGIIIGGIITLIH